MLTAVISNLLYLPIHLFNCHNNYTHYCFYIFFSNLSHTFAIHETQREPDKLISKFQNKNDLDRLVRSSILGILGLPKYSYKDIYVNVMSDILNPR